MRNVETRPKAVQGQVFGNGQINLLDPVLIFKGKLRAAASPGKFHDSADLRWLESRYSDLLCQNRHVFRLDYVGLAFKRYNELQFVFQRIGINLNTALAAAAQLDPEHMPPPMPGDVLTRILS